jgi:assimilatory nitrate reductase catalytic subunit
MAPAPAAIRTTCAYCGVGCGICATVTGPRAVIIAGDRDHPANLGRLCSKGTHLGETVGLEGRLLHPMIGDARVSWDAALDEVADRLRRTIAEHGPGSVAFYVSGQLLTEDYYVANKLMKGFVGSANIDTNSRLCMASAVAAHSRAFGEDIVPCSYADLDDADLIVLVGSNTAWCHPVIWQQIEAARAARGTQLVVIDPRRTETAELADLHIPITPDGDVALFNALLARLRATGAAPADAVDGPDGFWAALNQAEPGIDAALFDRFAALVAAHPRMVTLFSQGANQSIGGTDKGNAIINLHLATGRINRPGAGPFSVTGQPNAMGGREVGGLANTLACHLGFSPAERADVAGLWRAERMCTAPGLKAVEMFRAIHDGRIKFLWVMATNPAVSMPDAGFVREALARCPTVVVSDVIADTDTARAWAEKDGTVTNSERMVSRQRALFAAPGEARADWRIVCDVAARLGWGDSFEFATPAAIWREYAGMTALAARHGKVFDLSAHALSDEEYAAMAPFQWGGRHPLAAGYPTPSGRATLVAVVAPAPTASDAAWPLRLNTGRYRDQWHTMTRTGLAPTLSSHRREPLVEIHPLDALACAIADGALARVATASGTAVFRASVTDSQRPGEVFVPMHWSEAMAGGSGHGGGANRLPGQHSDPISGQPAFKNTPALVEAVTPAWRGFLVTTASPVPAALLWWSRSRVAQGWLYELAGDRPICVDELLPPGERIEAADPTRGMRRLAVRGQHGALVAALFITRSGTLPPREWVGEQLGQSEAEAAELLAARPRTAVPERGPILCVCHAVGTNAIIAAACAGAATVAAIGEATRAGSNCGSCRPAIARLLAAAPDMELVP